MANISFEVWLDNTAGTQRLTAGYNPGSMAMQIGKAALDAHVSRAMSGFANAFAICRARGDALNNLMTKYALHLDSIFRTWSPDQVRQYCASNTTCQYCAFLDCLDIRYEYGKAYHDHHPWSPSSWYQDANKRSGNPNPAPGFP